MRCLNVVLAFLMSAMVFSPARAAPPSQDLTTMSSNEVETLQRRLLDAKCYNGAIDGKPNDALRTAISACPDQQPFLRIETGMHVAAIRSVGVDAQCTTMVTSSDDKTVRLWSLPDGRAKQILRWPIAVGNGGKAYAVGLSPDGTLVAVSGWDARYDSTGRHSVMIFDATSGTVVKRIDGLEETVKRLLFSPDGHWLAATLGSGWGLRLIDTQTWKIVQGYRGFGGDSYGVSFGPDGRVYTVSYDGKLRQFGPGPQFRFERDVTTRSGRHPYSVSVDSQNQRIVVGFEDQPAIDAFDTNLAYKGAANTRFANRRSNISIAMWRADGQTMLAGGGFSVGNKRPVMLFDRSGRLLHYGSDPAALDTILDIKPCGDGFVQAAYGPVFALLDAQASPLMKQTGVTADMRDKRDDAFLVSDDTTRVRFGLDDAAGRPMLFDLKAGTFEPAPTADTSTMHQPITDGLPIANWINSLNPTFAGQPIKLEINDEFSRDVAIRPQRDGFALGADYRVRGFDSEGHLLWKNPLPGIAWGTNFSADGQVLVVAYGDGTIRWHRWSDGQELLALFVNAKTNAWVVWTPSGYYMASPGAEDMIGWHINRGWQQAADFFPASRFRDKFNRPDIVRLILTTLDERAAIDQANETSHRKSDDAPLVDHLPPVINIVSPADGATVTPGPIEINYKTRSPSGGKVDRVEVFVDGAKVQTRGLSREGVTSAPGPGGDGKVMVVMPQHKALVSLVAYENGRASDAVKLQLDPTTGEDRSLSATAPALKPNLYALLIGVSKYQNESFNLGYSAEDAKEFGAALEGQKGKLYRNVEVKLLTDSQATSNAVKDGLLWLQSQTTSRDLALVFAAGHGITDAKGRFWFLTSDGDPKRLLTTAVSRDDFSEVLFDLPGKKLLFLDACHSGAALNAGARGVEQTDIGAALNDFTQAEGGVVAYAASTGKELSFERDEWRHGAFTKALIEALGQGKADLLRNGTITTSTLDAYIADRVKQLTGGQQHPEMTRPKTVPDFPIALTQ